MNSAETFEALSLVMPYMVIDGHTGEIKAANELACSLVGRTEDELVGNELSTVMPERHRSSHPHFRRGYMENPLPRPMGRDRDIFIRHKNGDVIPVWIGLSPVGDEGLVVAGILAKEGLLA